MAITLSKDVKRRMVEHLRSVHPCEGCGLLAGKEQRATEIFPIANIEEAIPERRYLMDPREQLRAFKAIDSAGLELVAIYHSHPSSEAHPSPTDVGLAVWQEGEESIEVYPGVAYMIVSLKEIDSPVVRAFWIRAGGKIEEEPVEVEVD